ncbi:MAG: hypothetical protein Kow0069_05270 [Promethearchaeota archaeon]
MNLDKIRDVPGWRDAPVPICMGGDYRALTFCCKPGHALTFGDKCRRDETLAKLGLSPDEFVRIKEEFSAAQEPGWDAPETCFGSLSYCCMRRGGCPRRDPALASKYPGASWEDVLAAYFSKKKLLARAILERSPNQKLAEKYLRR